MYKIKARYYADPDQFGESFVITSDNGEIDMRLEIGQTVKIVPICTASGCKEIATVSNLFCVSCNAEHLRTMS